MDNCGERRVVRRAEDIESIARGNLNLNAIACSNPRARLLHLFQQISVREER